MSKSKKRRATHPRQGWFTREEAAQIDTLAKPLGGFADLVRASVLGYKPPSSKLDAPALAKLLAELGKIGSNVNQLAKRANEGRFNADMIDDAMRELMEWRLLVMQALGQERPRPPADEPE
jgi:hypothetical protein